MLTNLESRSNLLYYIQHDHFFTVKIEKYVLISRGHNVLLIIDNILEWTSHKSGFCSDKPIIWLQIDNFDIFPYTILILAREFRLYMDFENSDWSITA